MVEEERKIIKISVRNLVEFILRTGDITSGSGKIADPEAMLLGGKIHRKIQRSMGSNYQAEVSLKRMINFDTFDLNVEGRADGILIEESGVTIDEIKGVFTNLIYLEEAKEIHKAQAKCYAYMYGMEKEVKEMTVQVTYCNLETEEIKRFRYVYTMEELDNWFMEVVGAYEKWARFQIQWVDTRNQSIKNIEFPFSYREGQKELVTSVYKTILRKKKLFIQAPTGIGKTMATVFPAVKAVGEGLGDKIFYLTSKTIARTVAEQAFQMLQEQNLQFKAITLTAKEKICILDECACNPETCPRAKGHFNRVNDAVYELLISSNDFNRTKIEEHASVYNVCPFEMMLDLSIWVDGVICDYNYLFDPNARLKRFFAEGVRGEYLFLIDEAHNLVERGRNIYSAELYKEDFLELKKVVKYYDVKLAKRLETCNKVMLEYKKECETYQVLQNAGTLPLKLMNLITDLTRVRETCDDSDVLELVVDMYFKVNYFLYIHDRMDEHYVVYTEYEPEGRFKMRLYCVNPSVNIQECLDRGNSAIYFSATLLPIQYYKNLLSSDPENYAIYVDSPFEQKNRLLLKCNDVSTKYTMRSPQMYQRYGQYIEEIILAKSGNYLVFFPSYLFMEEVYQAFIKRVETQMLNDEILCMAQQVNMKEAEREEFLNAFESIDETTASVVGFCVMGGIFSEGIDLTNEQLIGAIVVGTGLPGVSREREILQNYFQEKEGKGFDYAYLYPGMNKVQQAAGRVIRTAEDRGIIALLDERFSQNQYRETFPREWNDMKDGNIRNIGMQIKNFWEETS